MYIVINIPDSDYGVLMHDRTHHPRTLTNTEWLIANGVPLHKIISAIEDHRCGLLNDGIDVALKVIDNCTKEDV